MSSQGYLDRVTHRWWCNEITPDPRASEGYVEFDRYTDCFSRYGERLEKKHDHLESFVKNFHTRHFHESCDLGWLYIRES